jgi:GTP cyclohydrolase I
MSITTPDAARHRLMTGMAAWMASKGLDPDGPALSGTPARMVAALDELTAGYREDPAAVLTATFDVDRSDDMIIVTGVPFVSVCEHHVMPFTGTACVAYIPTPGAPVVGLSKLARLVDVYARRLQVQETLTHQVTRALDDHLSTQGSACVIRAAHGCMTHRGARKAGSAMVTASYTGVFRTDPAMRAELHALSAS